MNERPSQGWGLFSAASSAASSASNSSSSAVSLPSEPGLAFSPEFLTKFRQQLSDAFQDDFFTEAKENEFKVNFDLPENEAGLTTFFHSPEGEAYKSAIRSGCDKLQAWMKANGLSYEASVNLISAEGSRDYLSDELVFNALIMALMHKRFDVITKFTALIGIKHYPSLTNENIHSSLLIIIVLMRYLRATAVLNDNAKIRYFEYLQKLISECPVNEFNKHFTTFVNGWIYTALCVDQFLLAKNIIEKIHKEKLPTIQSVFLNNTPTVGHYLGFKNLRCSEFKSLIQFLGIESVKKVLTEDVFVSLPYAAVEAAKDLLSAEFMHEKFKYALTDSKFNILEMSILIPRSMFSEYLAENPNRLSGFIDFILDYSIKNRRYHLDDNIYWKYIQSCVEAELLQDTLLECLIRRSSNEEQNISMAILLSVMSNALVRDYLSKRCHFESLARIANSLPEGVLVNVFSKLDGNCLKKHSDGNEQAPDFSVLSPSLSINSN